ncbi:MAG: patatin-like phospholipase family protein [Paenibacillaceae bacterium]
MKINAVFEGGGVKGIAIVGAVHAVEEYGFEFNEVAGTSSGAIIASLLAAGYTSEQLKQLILDTPFQEFVKTKTKWIGPSIRLLFKKGLYSGDPIERWIHELLAKKGIYTFADLPDRKLRIIASDISDGRIMVLPDDLPLYDLDPSTFLVSRAVRMSASIPYFFEPVLIRRKKTLPIYIVDGGLLSNFPLWIFDQEYMDATRHSRTIVPTIGFQLVGKLEQVPRRIAGPVTMFYALFATMMEAHDERYIEDHNRYRTIKIPTLGVRTTQFELSDEVSMRLFESGYGAGRKFIEQWSISAYQKDFTKHVTTLKA